MNFDDTNDYIDCGSGPSNFDNITVNAWIQTSISGVIVSNRYDASGYGTWYTFSSNNIEIGDNTQGGYRSLNFSQNALNGFWHHVVYTKNGTNHSIYIDGVPDQQFTSNADISSSVPLYIGKRWNKTSGQGWFNGKIDEVKIYNRALSPQEVALLYTQ